VYALLGGVVSMPVTVVLYWSSGGGSEFVLDAVLLAGLLAGFLAARRGVDADAVGVRAGVVGGVPGVVWLLPKVLDLAAGLSGPTWFEAVGVALVVGTTVGLIALVFAFSALLGLVGARVGGWATRRAGLSKPATQ